MIQYPDLFRKGISLERLATLCRVVDQGGIARAADGDMSKLTLYSKQIKELGAALGVPLTKRVGRLAVPSPAAHRLAALTRDHFKALAGFAAEEGARPMKVTFGASSSLMEWVVLPALSRLRRAIGGNASIRLLTYRSRDLVEALLDRQLDVGLVRSTAVGRGLKTRPVMDLGYSLFAPKALGQGKGAEEILREAPLAIAAGGEFRDQLKTNAERSGIDLNIALECPSFSMAARAVLGGSYAAILPEIASVAFEGLATRKLALPFKTGPSRRILLAWHPNASEKIVAAAAAALVVQGPRIKRPRI